MALYWLLLLGDSWRYHSLYGGRLCCSTLCRRLVKSWWSYPLLSHSLPYFLHVKCFFRFVGALFEAEEDAFGFSRCLSWTGLKRLCVSLFGILINCLALLFLYLFCSLNFAICVSVSFLKWVSSDHSRLSAFCSLANRHMQYSCATLCLWLHAFIIHCQLAVFPFFIHSPKFSNGRRWARRENNRAQVQIGSRAWDLQWDLGLGGLLQFGLVPCFVLVSKFFFFFLYLYRCAKSQKESRFFSVRGKYKKRCLPKILPTYQHFPWQMIRGLTSSYDHVKEDRVSEWVSERKEVHFFSAYLETERRTVGELNK